MKPSCFKSTNESKPFETCVNRMLIDHPGPSVAEQAGSVYLFVYFCPCYLSVTTNDQQSHGSFVVYK